MFPSVGPWISAWVHLVQLWTVGLFSLEFGSDGLWGGLATQAVLVKTWGRVHLLAVAGLFPKADVQGLSLWLVFSCIVRFENSGFKLSVCLKPQGNQVVYLVTLNIALTTAVWVVLKKYIFSSELKCNITVARLPSLLTNYLKCAPSCQAW